MMSRLMSNLFYKTLLDDFSRSLEMQPLVFDDHGTCNMIIDNTFALTLSCDYARERLLLIGLLEPHKDIPQHCLLAGALNPLLNAGPGLGLDEKSGLYHAYQSIPREKLSVPTLKREMAGLLEWMRGWREASQ
ncbi:Type III chaperone protein ShcA [Pseudomonas syringae pv. coriandricola]|uniref:Type III chaperone protein ShcA n=4 Tax=Pseudomonas TaxID=286 RepID=A0A3M4U4R3_9PSED|nr:Type III chaperone protein ShcA [Pseudomonas syringae pv. maculicola]RMR20336.1 Type III chaperone protein ShcA [Pseudomonas syringae pv. persicae]RMR34674.1 Type III chaperone protein ShcA [Pseudomonas syringae pv. coriandricola]RMT99446.1 Type III chaperone protein ShcA [Pseudomonas syringae pv. coriandricola]